MPTVVNDMILEPKAAPPPESSKTASAEKNAGASPEMERKVVQLLKKKHELTLRLCAY